MTNAEHQVRLAISKVQDNTISSVEVFENEYIRLKNLVDLELEPLIKSGQVNYRNFLNAVLTQFSELKSKLVEPKVIKINNPPVSGAAPESLVFES